MSLLAVSIADVSCAATVDETVCGDEDDSALISVPACDNVQNLVSARMTNLIKYVHKQIIAFVC